MPSIIGSTAPAINTDFGTYSAAWVERYQEKELCPDRPGRGRVLPALSPGGLEAAGLVAETGPRVSERRAGARGRQSGLLRSRSAGPNGQFAVFTVSHNCDDEAWERLTERYSRDMILMAHYFNRKALEFEPERTPEQAQPLSPQRSGRADLSGDRIQPCAGGKDPVDLRAHAARLHRKRPVQAGRNQYHPCNCPHCDVARFDCDLTVGRKSYRKYTLRLLTNSRTLSSLFNQKGTKSCFVMSMAAIFTTTLFWRIRCSGTGQTSSGPGWAGRCRLTATVRSVTSMTRWTRCM